MDGGTALALTIAMLAQTPALEPLAPGVYALTHDAQIGFAQNGNSLVVVGDSAVLIVDAQFTREATRRTLAAIRAVTARPVRYVVNTHWHDDHMAGNQVYRDSFPGVRFVMHTNTRTDFLSVGQANRRNELTHAPPVLQRYRRLYAAGLGTDSMPLTGSARQAIGSALELYGRYLEEADGFEEAIDGLTVQERATLDLGGRRVDLYWFGRGATRGDLVVHVPDAGVVATGDLLVHPIPFAFTAYPSEWISVLDAIAALRPQILVPGHGPVQRDIALLARTRLALSLPGSDSLRHAVTGGDPWFDRLWDGYFRAPVVMRAAREERLARTPLDTGTTVIANANVIPMTAPDAMLQNHTVVIRSGRVVAIDPAGTSAPPPAGARVIDARGRYLIPGLTDTHAHLFADGEEIADSAADEELRVMLANGVTTVRLMIGNANQLAVRRRILHGEVLGPMVWVASPHLTSQPIEGGAVVASPEAARDSVRRFAAAGYDFVKITFVSDSAVYDAIIEEARRSRIRTVGHVPLSVSLSHALRTGQQLSHLDMYLESVLADSAPSRVSLTQYRVFDPRSWPSLDYVDARKIAAIAGETARSGVWIEPTLNVFNAAFGGPEPEAVIRARPDWEMWPPRSRAGYLAARERFGGDTSGLRTAARRARYVDVRNRLVKAISDSGGQLLAGSDTPEWFHVYGWGLHRELRAFVQAGLTPYEALATATRNAAEYFGAAGEWGTIEPGARADLILLRANPLERIEHTTAIDAVLIGGRVLRRPELDAMIEAGRRAIDGRAPPGGR